MKQSKEICERYRETAHHEAGHVLILSLFGYCVESVSIFENGEGVTNYTPHINTDSLESITDKFAVGCIAIAGSVSEDMFRGIKEPGTSFALGGGVLDLIDYQNLKLPKGSFLPLLDITNEIIKTNWSHISEFAEILYEKKNLEASDINIILEKWI
jgi:hypothetical protein